MRKSHEKVVREGVKTNSTSHKSSKVNKIFAYNVMN